MKIRKLMITISMIVFSCLSNAEDLKPTVAEHNDFWNRYITYTAEPTGDDVWQTPKETWEKQTGDCEDYAIVKYFDMIASGVDKEKLSLAWVILDNKFNIKQKIESHVVLLYENNGKKWVLDNYASNIVELNKRSDIVLVNAIMNHNSFSVVYGKAEKMQKKWNEITKNFDKHVAFIKSLEPNLTLVMQGISPIKKS